MDNKKTEKKEINQQVPTEKGYQTLLSYIQQNLVSPKLRDNSFGGYKYRSLEDCLSAVKPLLGNIGTIKFNDEIFFLEGRFYVKATLTLTDLINGAVESTSAFAREATDRPKMSEDQVTGSASSYARKYAFNAMFLTDDSSDPDGKKPKPSTQELTKEEQAIIDEMYKRLIDTAGENNLIPDKSSIRVFAMTKTTAKRLPANNEEVTKLVDYIINNKKLNQVCKPIPKNESSGRN